MAPKRKELPLKSIWDETYLNPILTNPKHRVKLWRHLINSFAAQDSHPNVAEGVKDRSFRRRSTCMGDIPFAEWCFPRAQYQSITESLSLFTTKVIERSESSRGDTTKLLVELQDGHRVETVIMRHRGHATVCISSQIGCQMGCRFCATGTMGIIGDLTAGEILEQLVWANSVTRIRNVVFMGMGEPLNNYENVKKAVLFMIDTKLFALCKFTSTHPSAARVLSFSLNI
jgi:tRNA A37 methylthiotransferase MiaB